jgi:hypothetical protein
VFTTRIYSCPCNSTAPPHCNGSQTRAKSTVILILHLIRYSPIWPCFYFSTGVIFRFFSFPPCSNPPLPGTLISTNKSGGKEDYKITAQYSYNHVFKGRSTMRRPWRRPIKMNTGWLCGGPAQNHLSNPRVNTYRYRSLLHNFFKFPLRSDKRILAFPYKFSHSIKATPSLTFCLHLHTFAFFFSFIST